MSRAKCKPVSSSVGGLRSSLSIHVSFNHVSEASHSGDAERYYQLPYNRNASAICLRLLLCTNQDLGAW